MSTLQIRGSTIDYGNDWIEFRKWLDGTIASLPFTWSDNEFAYNIAAADGTTFRTVTVLKTDPAGSDQDDFELNFALTNSSLQPISNTAPSLNSNAIVTRSMIYGLGQTGYQPDPKSYPDVPLTAILDASMRLETHSNVLTDENSYREDFSGNSLITLLGSAEFVNGSNIVTGTGFTTSGLSTGDYIKKTSDSETFYAAVASIDSDTQITLEEPYGGTTGSALVVFSHWKTLSAGGGGAAINIANSIVSINSGTLNGNQTYIFREADYPPFTLRFVNTILSARNATQTTVIGFSSALSLTPENFAIFQFTGTDNTQVTCASGSSSDAADQQFTTVSIPAGGTTNTSHEYKIDVSAAQVTYIIDGIIVASHRLHIPDPYITVGVIAGITNTGASTNSILSIDLCFFNNTNRIQIDDDYVGEPIQVFNSDQISTASLGALNAAVTIPINSLSGAAFQLAAGTLVGTIIPEVSIDGSIWTPVDFLELASGASRPSYVFTTSNTAVAASIRTMPGVGFVRIRVSAYTSGTAKSTLRASSVSENYSLISSTDGHRASYSASVVGLSAAANPTDIFTITGSATKTVRITRIMVSGTQNTAAVRDVVILKRSTANSGGNSTSPAAVPFDSLDPAATAIVRAYTTNPTTLGALVGNIETRKVVIPTTTGNPTLVEVAFGIRNNRSIVLRGTNEVLAINLNAVSSNGNSFDITIEWTEE